MSFIIKMLNQTAVYWGNPVPDGQGGYTFDAPIEIPVRWEERTEKFMSAEGEEVISQAVVFVNQDIEISSYLFLGELVDLESSQTVIPSSSAGSFIVKAVKKIPSVGGDEFERRVWL